LRLNIVSRGETQFIESHQWEACAGDAFIEPGAPIYAGLDLSETEDLSALCWLSPGDRGIRLQARFWLPSDNIVTLERRHQQPYREWAEAGLIVLTPGNVIDYGFIRREVNELAQRFDLRKLLTDPYNATKLGIELAQEDGLPVEAIRQGFLSLSAPTKELKRLIVSQQLLHGGNPILRWHARNAVTVQDAAGNLKLHKEKSRKKIDGLAAAVNAVAALSGAVDERSVYEDRGVLCL
jgi:phage terminase large subunit-like protein